MSRKSISSATRSGAGESTISNRVLFSNAWIIYHKVARQRSYQPAICSQVCQQGNTMPVINRTVSTRLISPQLCILYLFSG
ncbi:uncharacterized protein METZ01_LOCUS364939, partial [marine metagenome]